MWQKEILIKATVEANLKEVNKIPSKFPFVNGELIKSCMKAQLPLNQIHPIINLQILVSA